MIDNTGIIARIVPRDMVPSVWPLAGPELARALARADGENSLEDILRFIMHERMQLWAVHEGAAVYAFTVTEVVKYGRMSVCRIVLWAGYNLKDSKHAARDIEDFALEQGCTAVEWVGRPGFERTMKKQGYKKQYVLMRKHLTKDFNGTLH